MFFRNFSVFLWRNPLISGEVTSVRAKSNVTQLTRGSVDTTADCNSDKCVCVYVGVFVLLFVVIAC